MNPIALLAGLILFFSAAAFPADVAQEGHQHGVSGAKTTAAETTGEKSFADLMGDAMNVMQTGMSSAPMNGDADHDFAAMMIPHHQGAIDMAKAELLYGKNPVLRRLAQEIIVTQNSEIAVMQAQLNRSSSTPTKR
jgi:uncharacterized protein (DUF305 family)